MTGYQTGGNNQITTDGTWTYTFDQEGNLIKKSKGANAETWTFGYDNLNHLIWAKDSATDGGSATTLATYVYDVFGDRIEKDVWTSQSGTTTVSRFAWEGDQIWADLNGSNSLVTRYLLGDDIDQLIARVAASGTAAWYLTDRLGSVRDLTDNSGGLIDHLNYDGLGNVTSEAQPSVGDRFKWTGRELDSETGLQYNRARYYDSKTGRWISQDPIGFSAGDANLYRYVRNQADMFKDPSGAYANPYSPPPSVTLEQINMTSMEAAMAADEAQNNELPDWYKKMMAEANAREWGHEVPLHIWKKYYNYESFKKYNPKNDPTVTEEMMRRYMKAHPGPVPEPPLSQMGQQMRDYSNRIDAAQKEAQRQFARERETMEQVQKELQELSNNYDPKRLAKLEQFLNGLRQPPPRVPFVRPPEPVPALPDDTAKKAEEEKWRRELMKLKLESLVIGGEMMEKALEPPFALIYWFLEWTGIVPHEPDLRPE